MSWLLTTPVAVGDLDTAAYAEVQIVRMTHDSISRIISVTLECGNTNLDGYVWIPGISPRSKITFTYIQGADYDTLTSSAMPNPGESTYDATKRALYEYLFTAGIIGAGTMYT